MAVSVGRQANMADVPITSAAICMHSPLSNLFAFAIRHLRLCHYATQAALYCAGRARHHHHHLLLRTWLAIIASANRVKSDEQALIESLHRP